MTKDSDGRADAAVLMLFDDIEAPVVTPAQVAEELGSSVRGAKELLFRMNADGMVRFDYVHGGSIWWPTAKPAIEPEAETLLLDEEFEEPLSIDDIYQIASKFVE